MDDNAYNQAILKVLTSGHPVAPSPTAQIAPNPAPALKVMEVLRHNAASHNSRKK